MDKPIRKEHNYKLRSFTRNLLGSTSSSVHVDGSRPPEDPGRKEHCILWRAVDGEAVGRVSDGHDGQPAQRSQREHKGDPVQLVFGESRQPQVPDKNAGLLRVIMNSLNYSVTATKQQEHTQHRQGEGQHACCCSEPSDPRAS